MVTVTMLTKDSQKKLKQIQKKISILEKERLKIEFRPCRGDSDLKQKDEDFLVFRQKMLALEKERDQFVFNASGVKHFQWEDSTPKE